MKNIQQEHKYAGQLYLAFRQGWFSVFQPVNMPVFDLPDFSRGTQRDTEAIAGDWRQVGNALRSAMVNLPNGR